MTEFPEKGMTFIQFAQHVIPGLSAEEADWVLWEKTPFPLVQGRDDLMPYLVAERDRRLPTGDASWHADTPSAPVHDETEDET